MPTLIDRTLSENRGNPRVWMEGEKLAREGIQPGMKYNLIPNKTGITVKFTSDGGKYIVNKRTKRGTNLTQPLIEIRDTLLWDIFPKGQKLRVVINKEEINITAHYMDKRVQERVESLVAAIKQGKPLRLGSAYHGGGGLDIATHCGLGLAGIKSKIAVAIEKEAKYLDSSLRNNKSLFDSRSVIIESPIQDLNFGYGSKPFSCHGVLMGIPYEGSSQAGRSKNGHWGDSQGGHAESHAEVGSMFFNALEFIRSCNPSFVVLENVDAYSHSASADIIRSVLTSWKYKFTEVTLTGTDFGSLEKRPRWALVAITEGLEEYGYNLADLDLTNIPALREKPENLSAIMEDVPTDPENKIWKRAKYLEDKEKSDQAAGKGFKRQLLTGLSEFCGTIGKSYAKIRSTEPMIMHPDYLSNKLIRLFTAKEHCLLKGFPESFVSNNSTTTAHEILGQSVIFYAFEALAFKIGKFFNKDHQIELPLAA